MFDLRKTYVKCLRCIKDTYIFKSCIKSFMFFCFNIIAQ